MPQSASDIELVRAAQSGQAHAFATLVLRTQGMARAIAYSSTGDYDNAEDLAQEALVTAWAQLSELKEPSKFRPWLAGIVRNTARYWRRHQGRHAPAAQEGLERIESMASAELSPLEEVEQRENWQQANAALRVLPNRYREPLLLYYTLGESHAQVAGALGMSEAAVRQRLCRARKKLRDELAPVKASALRLAGRASAAAAIMLAIQSRQAWSAPLPLSPATGLASSPKFFFGLGALTGGALIACTTALVMLVAGGDSQARPGGHQQTEIAQEEALAGDTPRKDEVENREIASEIAGSVSAQTNLSMGIPRATVRIGSGKVKGRPQGLRRAPRQEFEPAGGDAKTTDLRPRATSGGRIRKHGPAVIKAESSKPLLRPSLSIREVQRDLWSVD